MVIIETNKRIILFNQALIHSDSFSEYAYENVNTSNSEFGQIPLDRSVPNEIGNIFEKSAYSSPEIRDPVEKILPSLDHEEKSLDGSLSDPEKPNDGKFKEDYFLDESMYEYEDLVDKDDTIEEETNRSLNSDSSSDEEENDDDSEKVLNKISEFAKLEKVTIHPRFDIKKFLTFLQ
jgi:hypothetical protein